MKNTPFNRFNTTLILMFFLLPFLIAPTYANTGATHWNVDAIFGHMESSEFIEKHDSEWPIEEQPGDVNAANPHSPVAEDWEDMDEHDSEWPTEEQPDSIC